MSDSAIDGAVRVLEGTMLEVAGERIPILQRIVGAVPPPPPLHGELASGAAMTAVPEASPATVPAANTGGGFWGGLIGFIEFFIARARDCFSWPVVLLLVMFLPTSPLASTFVVLPSLVSHASTLDIAGVKIAVASDHQIPAPSSIAGKIRALTSADLHLLMTSNVSLPTSIPLSRTHDMEAFAHLEKLNLIAEAHVDRSNPADPIELFSLSDDGRKTYDYFIDVLIDVLKLPE